LASALERRGWTTTVPDLRADLRSPAAYLAAAVAGPRRVDVVLGHSGAGAFIPTTAQRTGAAVSVFIDAVVPGDTPVFTPSGRFLELVDGVPVEDGRLAPWHTWWPADVLAELVPDEALRTELTEDVPRVPRSFYDDPVPLPPRWWARPTAFLQLSDAYGDERRRAERWGWPTLRLNGHHLDLATRPDEIAEHLRRLVDSAGTADH
jgi:hypothetical protein